jgi:hypothetical protein
MAKPRQWDRRSGALRRAAASTNRTSAAKATRANVSGTGPKAGTA